MKVMLFLLAVAGTFASPSLEAACTYPKAPEKLPDGSMATLEEMRSGQKSVQNYDKEINAYLACLTFEHNATVAQDTDKFTAEQKAEMARMQAQRHNAAVEKLEAIAARFNEQLKIFKARKDKS